MKFEAKQFLKEQHNILKGFNVNSYSMNIKLSWNEDEQKLKKTPWGQPDKWGDRYIDSSYDPSCNASMIMLGDRYNLIGVDVDNKNGTLEFFNDLAEKNGFEFDTLTQDTVNKGKHYFFRLTDEQREVLKDFTATTAQAFSTPSKPRNIDIKYNNQIFFGPSYLEWEGEVKKYEICTLLEPAILPGYLFDEIVRSWKESAKQQKTTKAKTKKPAAQKATVEIKADPIDQGKVDRLTLYLNCLDDSCFDNRDDWLTIGAIIFNECKSYNLFIEYSKKSPKYDEAGCKSAWKSFNDDREKKATIKRLIEMAEQDSVENGALYRKAVMNDRIAILDHLFANGPSDVYFAYLFWNMNKTEFIYDPINKQWYYFDSRGMWKADAEGDSIKSRANECLYGVLKQEYTYRFNAIPSDDDNKSTKCKTLFKAYQKLDTYCNSAKSKSNLISEVRLLYTVEKIYETMDTVNPFAIGFDNGVFDLKTMKLRKGLPEEYISISTGYKFEQPNSKQIDEVMKVFQTIFEDKEELNFMLKELSLHLVGSNCEEKFDVWVGEGGNGKGFIRDMLKAALGMYTGSIDMTYFSAGNYVRAGGADSVMAAKKHLRGLIGSETDKDQALRPSIIKSVSGRDPLEVRGLWQKPFTFTPMFKLVIQTQHLPEFKPWDGGLGRRVRIIRFRLNFTDNPTESHHRLADPSLKSKIPQWKNAIFWILAQHYQKYTEEGLKMPPRFEQDTKEYIRDNDCISTWFETNIKKTGSVKDTIKASDLLDDFKEFMDHDMKGVTATGLKAALAIAGVRSTRKGAGVYYSGIKFKNMDMEEEEHNDSENDEEGHDE